MSRLTFIVVDEEKDYVDAFTGYLMENYPGKYSTHSFTNNSSLIVYLNENSTKWDIILINDSLYQEMLPLDGGGVVVILSETSNNRHKSKINSVYKYQHGDKIVREVMNIYSKNHNAAPIDMGKVNKTKIVGIYSAAGGNGKTTLALSMSIQCAQSFKNILYLNLEDINSTGFFFNDFSGPGLSNIIYYLKEESENIELRIEEASCLESIHNINFFLPTDNILDLEELFPDELQSMLSSLRKSNYYDIVFVDMSSSFNKRNMVVFDDCDEIFLIIGQDNISFTKSKMIIKELELHSKKSGLDYSKKIIPILNKYRDDITKEDIYIENKPIQYKIPYCKNIDLSSGIGEISRREGTFYEGIQSLSNRFL